jgi:hypothetical protein
LSGFPKRLSHTPEINVKSNSSPQTMTFDAVALISVSSFLTATRILHPPQNVRVPKLSLFVRHKRVEVYFGTLPCRLIENRKWGNAHTADSSARQPGDNVGFPAPDVRLPAVPFPVTQQEYVRFGSGGPHHGLKSHHAGKTVNLAAALHGMLQVFITIAWRFFGLSCYTK